MNAALISVPWIPSSMSCDEEVGDLVGAAGDEEGRQVVVGVDAGAGDHLQAGLLGDPAHERDVTAEEHRGRLDDRLHPELDRRAGRLDRLLVVAAGLDRVRRLVRATVPAFGHCTWTASSQVRRCSWISVVPSSPASIGPVTLSTLAMPRQSMPTRPIAGSLRLDPGRRCSWSSACSTRGSSAATRPSSCHGRDHRQSPLVGSRDLRAVRLGLVGAAPSAGLWAGAAGLVGPICFRVRTRRLHMGVLGEVSGDLNDGTIQTSPRGRGVGLGAATTCPLLRRSPALAGARRRRSGGAPAAVLSALARSRSRSRAWSRATSTSSPARRCFRSAAPAPPASCCGRGRPAGGQISLITAITIEAIRQTISTAIM